MKDTQYTMYNPSPHPTNGSPHFTVDASCAFVYRQKILFVVFSEIPAGKVKDVTFIGST